jgi:hypothetical protein
MARRKEARTNLRSAPLSGEFGLKYATNLFGEETIASLPVISRGPNKGKPKGYVLWLRTIEPGYHPNAAGGVGADTTVRAWLGEGQYTAESNALVATWLGREQNVCGSMHLLGPTNREKWVAEQARMRAEERGETQGEDA